MPAAAAAMAVDRPQTGPIYRIADWGVSWSVHCCTGARDTWLYNLDKYNLYIWPKVHIAQSNASESRGSFWPWFPFVWVALCLFIGVNSAPVTGLWQMREGPWHFAAGNRHLFYDSSLIGFWTLGLSGPGL